MIRTAIISKIFYRINVGRSDSKTIPLGLLMQVTDVENGIEALILAAREELRAEERNTMDWAAQTILARPLEFFKREVDEAVEKHSADIFAYLSQKFSWSIYVAPAAEVPIPNELARNLQVALTSLRAPQKIKRLKVNTGARFLHRNDVSADFFRHAAPEFEVDLMVAWAPPAWIIDRANVHC